jgi:hypothetical protein
VTTANASRHSHKRYHFGTGESDGARALAFIKAHVAILGVGGSLLLAGIGATWHLANQVHHGDLEVRQTVRQSEQRLREEIGVLRGELHEEIGELRREGQANYRDLRDRIDGSP